MRIAHLVLHSCIRASKIAWLTMEKGHECYMITERPLIGGNWKDFGVTALIHTGQLEWNPDVDVWSIRRTIRALDPIVDVYHIHNEPDWPVEVVRRETSKPIVWDIHDLRSMREGKVDDIEALALEKCDGISVVSGRYKRLLQERTTKPIIEVLSAVPRKLYPTFRRVPSRRGLVYEGGLKGVDKEKSDQFHWRSWGDVFREISEMDIEVWAYPSFSPGENRQNYSTSGAMIMDSLPYDELLYNLTSHEAGLVGSPFPSPAFDGAMPNKLFEYIAAGIPVICMNAPAAEEFLLASGFGVGITDLKEIPDVLEQFRKENLRQYIWEMREHWCMERQIQKVFTLYSKVTGIEVDYEPM